MSKIESARKLYEQCRGDFSEENWQKNELHTE